MVVAMKKKQWTTWWGVVKDGADSGVAQVDNCEECEEHERKRPRHRTKQAALRCLIRYLRSVRQIYRERINDAQAQVRKEKKRR